MVYRPRPHPRDVRSWTRNVPLAEGLSLVDLVKVGMRTDDWLDRAEEVLNHADAHYKKTLARLVLRMFLTVEDGVIVDTAFLRLVQAGSERRRSDLFYARYGLAHAWTNLAARTVVLPTLEAAEAEGLAEAPVTLDQWDAFVGRHIEEEASEASRRKTRSTVLGVLGNLGVLTREGASTAPTMLRRGRPDPFAWGWVLWEQLVGELGLDMDTERAVHRSDASLLFATDAEYATLCLQAAVQEGLVWYEDGQDGQVLRPGR